MRKIALLMGLVFWLTLLTTLVSWILFIKPTSSQTISELKATAQPTASQSGQELLMSEMKIEIASLSARIASLEQQITKTQNTASTVAPNASALPAREYYIPLGSGATNNRDWMYVTGATVAFNPAKYQPIKRVYLEAAGSIISGEVHVVLTDLTHNRTFFEGELVFNTSNPTWLRSKPLTLSSAPSQLQIQIHSSNGEQGILNDSRLVVETGN